MLDVQILPFKSAEFLQNGNYGNNTDNYVLQQNPNNYFKMYFFPLIECRIYRSKVNPNPLVYSCTSNLYIPSTIKTQMIFVLLFSLGRLGFQGSTETFRDFAN